MVILTVPGERREPSASRMSDVSRSFLVDSLILKKPGSDVLPGSPDGKEVRRLSPSPSLRGFGALPQQLLANHHAFHSLPRPAGTGGLLDLCCPWCVQTPGSPPRPVPAGLPGLGMLPVPGSHNPSVSSAAASSLAAATAAVSAATLQQHHQQQLQQSRIMKPIVSRSTAASMVRPYIIPNRPALNALSGGSSAFRPRPIDTNSRSALNVLEARKIPYIGIGKFILYVFFQVSKQFIRI